MNLGGPVVPEPGITPLEEPVSAVQTLTNGDNPVAS